MDIISEFYGGTRYFAYWNNNGRYGMQIPVKSREDVISLIEKYNGLENCGISISTFIDNIPFLLFIPFDFDSKNDLHKAWLDAKKLFNFLSESKYKVSLVFSGNKGFHVILKTQPLIYTRTQLRDFQLFLKKYLKLKTFDMQIAGDIRRIIRIPGTYNSNGVLCRVIAESDGNLVNLNDFTTELQRQYYNNEYQGQVDIIHEYPCVERLIKDREFWYRNHPRHSFEPTWILRFAYVIELISKGLNDKEIVDKIEELRWDDFNRRKTEYFVRHIRRKQYLHPSCETLREFGYCDESCKYNMEFEPKRRRLK